jgi:hypothetical protein
MQTSTTNTTNDARAPQKSVARKLDLDALARLDSDELGRLYDRGKVKDVGALEGRPTGRMLAVRGLAKGRLSKAIRNFSGSRAFPWGGKSFAGQGDAGTGVNRVHLGGRHNVFPFLTHVAPSVVDGAPCIALDYDLPDNPGLIRKIHDEVREVDEGLFLGPAMWKGEGAPALVLWFALDTRLQAAPIGTKQGAL